MTEKTITFDRVVRWVGIGLLIICILLLLNHLSHVLLPFFVAWFFAYLLYPMVKQVERRLHVPRALSIIITLIIVIAIISGIVYLIIPPMIEQFEKLGNLATDYIHKSAHITSIPGTISEWITENQHEIEQ
ncbi:MAG: AI-2E family transporter, partial [Prevotella sp.]|nr:AI-2E family transporter [Prevotella sp.]